MLYPNQRMLVGINTAFSIIAILSVIARFANHGIRKMRPGLDDWLCFAALVSYIAQMGIVYVMIFEGGAGKPPSMYTAEDTRAFFKMTAAVQFPYGITMGLIRASIVVLVMKIFGAGSKRFRITCQFILGFVVLWTTYVIVQAIVLCRPFAANWDREIPGARCGNQVGLYIGIVVSGLVLDLAIFIAPLPMIWKLQMPTHQKVGLTLLFAVGLFDIITGAMRLVVTTQGVFTVITQALTWGILEPSIAIFVACAPKCKQVFYRAVPVTLLSNFSIKSLLSSKRRRTITKSSSTSSEDTLYMTGYHGRTKSSVTHDISVVHDATCAGQIAVRKDFEVYSEPRKDETHTEEV